MVPNIPSRHTEERYSDRGSAIGNSELELEGGVLEVCCNCFKLVGALGDLYE